MQPWSATPRPSSEPPEKRGHPAFTYNAAGLPVLKKPCIARRGSPAIIPSLPSPPSYSSSSSSDPKPDPQTTVGALRSGLTSAAPFRPQEMGSSNHHSHSAFDSTFNRPFSPSMAVYRAFESSTPKHDLIYGLRTTTNPAPISIPTPIPKPPVFPWPQQEHSAANPTTAYREELSTVDRRPYPCGLQPVEGAPLSSQTPAVGNPSYLKPPIMTTTHVSEPKRHQVKVTTAPSRSKPSIVIHDSDSDVDDQTTAPPTPNPTPRQLSKKSSQNPTRGISDVTASSNHTTTHAKKAAPSHASNNENKKLRDENKLLKEVMGNLKEQLRYQTIRREMAERVANDKELARTDQEDKDGKKNKSNPNVKKPVGSDNAKKAGQRHDDSQDTSEKKLEELTHRVDKYKGQMHSLIVLLRWYRDRYGLPPDDDSEKDKTT